MIRLWTDDVGIHFINVERDSGDVHVITTLPPKKVQPAARHLLWHFWYAVFLISIGVLIGHLLW